jgi:hypothetical protein
MKKKHHPKNEHADLESKDLGNKRITFSEMVHYISFLTGSIILLMGIYLTITNQAATGTTLPGAGGLGGGTKVILSGISLICIGAFFLILPIYTLIKRITKRRK